jgi:hypothetical protein
MTKSRASQTTFPIHQDGFQLAIAWEQQVGSLQSTKSKHIPQKVKTNKQIQAYSNQGTNKQWQKDNGFIGESATSTIAHA